jgi:hypothetical protein
MKRGLTNGNSLDIPRGMVIGLGKVNGIGRVNGLRGAKPEGRIRKGSSTASAINVAACVLVILAILVYMWPVSTSGEVAIDGSFREWSDVPRVAAGPIVVKEISEDRTLYLCIELPEPFPTSGGHSEPLLVFFDVDQHAMTGYSIAGLGADYHLDLRGYGSALTGARGGTFQSHRSEYDYNGFAMDDTVLARSNGTHVEIGVPWFVLRGSTSDANASYVVSYRGLEVLVRPVPGYSNPFLGKIPGSNITIDGDLSDWSNLPIFPDEDSEGRPDIREVQLLTEDHATSLRIDFEDTALHGDIPVELQDVLAHSNRGPGNASTTQQPSPVQDTRDTIVILLDTNHSAVVTGTGGRIYDASHYVHNGTFWAIEGSIFAAVNATSMELQLGIAATNVTVVASNWERQTDEFEPDGASGRSRTRGELPPVDPHDVSGNVVYYFRFTSTSETDCNTLNKAMSTTAGSGGTTVTLTNTNDAACWYYQVGQNIPAGDWDAVIDAGEGGGGQGAKMDIYLEVWDFTSNSVQTSIGSCTGINVPVSDYQCLITGVSAQTLGSEDGIRIKVTKSAGARTVIVQYDGPSAGSYDSRASIPIPEFEDVVLPVLVTVAVPIAVRWSRRE